MAPDTAGDARRAAGPGNEPQAHLGQRGREVGRAATRAAKAGSSTPEPAHGPWTRATRRGPRASIDRPMLAASRTMWAAAGSVKVPNSSRSPPLQKLGPSPRSTISSGSGRRRRAPVPRAARRAWPGSARCGRGGRLSTSSRRSPVADHLDRRSRFGSGRPRRAAGPPRAGTRPRPAAPSRRPTPPPGPGPATVAWRRHRASVVAATGLRSTTARMSSTDATPSRAPRRPARGLPRRVRSTATTTQGSEASRFDHRGVGARSVGRGEHHETVGSESDSAAKGERTSAASSPSEVWRMRMWRRYRRRGALSRCERWQDRAVDRARGQSREPRPGRPAAPWP